MEPQRNPKFQSLGYALNSLHLSYVAAFLRWLAYHTTVTISNRYQQPEQVGYKASIVNRHLGCLAFERLDGTLQFRW